MEGERHIWRHEQNTEMGQKRRGNSARNKKCVKTKIFKNELGKKKNRVKGETAKREQTTLITKKTKKNMNIDMEARQKWKMRKSNHRESLPYLRLLLLPL